ncbi:MAG: hypothetical protein IPM64_00460 [Phycisphaerales bacterium]|nr:hypothetical protein [Phycisphaerales bacterium]
MRRLPTPQTDVVSNGMATFPARPCSRYSPAGAMAALLLVGVLSSGAFCRAAPPLLAADDPLAAGIAGKSAPLAAPSAVQDESPATDSVQDKSPAAALVQDGVPASAPVRSAAGRRYLDDRPAPYSVGLIEQIELPDPRRDNARTRYLIRYPSNAPENEPRPLVIFSHGAGGSGNSFAELSEHWAGHGFVVIHPTHGDSIRLRRERGERVEDLGRDLASVIRRVRITDRCADVRLILDSLEQIESAISDHRAAGSSAPEGGDGPPRMRIDPQRIAMAGHSAGAMTTQSLAGVRFYAFGRAAAPFAEPRIGAFIVISGQGLSSRGFRRDSWSQIQKPMLVIAGSEDRSAVSDETPEGRRHPFEYAAPGDKYLLYIDGATHGSYAGKTVVRVLGEKPPKNIDYITSIVADGTLAFLDCHVRRRDSGCGYLDSDELERRTGGKVEVKRK